MCCASLLSSHSFALSRIKYNRSNRDMREGGRLMFSTIESLRSNWERMGFAEARMEVRAFSVVMMPALAMETVCCS